MGEDSLACWTSCWRSGKTLWDRHAPHPKTQKVLHLIQKYLNNNPQQQVYVPGCGRAHDAVIFANAKFNVVAVDFVTEAINAARTLYGHIPRLDFQVADVMKVKSHEIGFFDIVFDKSMCIALPPSIRPQYALACAQRLKHEGLFAFIINIKIFEKKGPPPYPMSVDEMKNILDNNFKLLFRAECHLKTNDVVSEFEIIELWQKKI